jgi:endonuclease III
LPGSLGRIDPFGALLRDDRPVAAGILPGREREGPTSPLGRRMSRDDAPAEAAGNADAAAAIAARLKEEYPEARTELRWENPLQLLVATVLSAQSTDVRVNQVTQGLFEKYRSAGDFARADPGELEGEIRPAGLARNKARSIVGLACVISEDHGGEVPRTMEELVALPGVGRKTANVVLGNAFGVDEGVVVDTHVRRLSNRLGLSARKDPEKVEQDLLRVVPEGERALFSHLLIFHGRRVCKARKPTCSDCVLSDLCPSAFAV